MLCREKLSLDKNLWKCINVNNIESETAPPNVHPSTSWEKCRPWKIVRDEKSLATPKLHMKYSWLQLQSLKTEINIPTYFPNKEVGQFW